VRYPVAIDFFGDAQLAFVEPAEDFGDGFADALWGLSWL